MKKLIIFCLSILFVIVVIVGLTKVLASENDSSASPSINKNDIKKKAVVKKTDDAVSLNLDKQTKKDLNQIQNNYEFIRLPEDGVVTHRGFISYDNGLVLAPDKRVIEINLISPSDQFTPSKKQYGVWIADIFKKKLVSPLPPNGKVVDGGINLKAPDSYDSPEKLQGKINAYFNQDKKGTIKKIESNKESWKQLIGADIDRELNILNKVITYSKGQTSLQNEVNQVIGLFKKANKKRDYYLYKKGSVKLLFIDYYIQKGLDHPDNYAYKD